MFERASVSSESSLSRPRRGLFGMLAGVLLTSTVVVAAPMAAGVVSAAPLITGTVTNDANADGVVNTAVGTGAEVGLGGVTVELLDALGASIDPDAGGPLTQTLTTTAADGSYSLDALVDGTYKVKVTTPAGYIVDPVAAGDVVRTSATTGVSADVVLAGVDAVVNPLVRPDFVLQLGYLNNPDGIITGAAPFDTADPACVPDPGVPTVPTILNDTTTPPGVDCTPYDDNVRSADNVAFNFAISGSADDDTVSSISDVVLRQTLTPTAGAIVNFARIPIACVPPSGGSGGTPPPTSKVEYLALDGITWVDYTGAGYSVPQDLPVAAAGRPLRLTCNKGTYSTGDASTLGTTVRVDGTSPEGSKFLSSAELFAVDNALNALAVPVGPLVAPEIEIKARPEWDFRKSGFYRQDWTTTDPDGAGPLGSVPGFYTYYSVMIGSDRKTGNEPLQQPIVIQDQLSFFQGDGFSPVTLTAGTDYFLQECRDFWPQSLGNFGGNVISKPSLATGDYNASMAVQNSGTCTVNATTGEITWSGIDFGGPYPTKTNTNQSLVAGPYLVANKWVRVFVPYTTLDNLFGDAADNDAGSGFLWNRITNIDPLGVSTNSNYGAGVEPGWCDGAITLTGPVPAGPGGVPPAVPANTGCNVMPQSDLLTGNTRSNDVAGPTSFTFSPGTFSKYLLKPNNNDRSYVLHDDMTSAHAGNGTIQPGVYTSTWLHWQSQSSTYVNPTQCDIWDNTMYQLVPLATAGVGSNSGASSSLYATATGSNTNPGFLTYQFASIPITGDDPLSGGLDVNTGRFVGTWTDQRASNCDEPGVTWYSDPNDPALGGIDNVNAVRVTGRASTQAIGDVPVMGPGSDRLLRVGLLARNTFYGGPNDGVAIPVGAVGANYGKVKSDNLSTGAGAGFYNNPSYLPSPENTNTDGDRLTWTRAVLGIKKRTIALDGLCDAPCAAAIDVNGSVLAGQFVVWEMIPVVNAASSQPAPVPDVVITDVLPPYIEYDAACTAALTGGTPADDVQINTPGAGQTTLTWYIGTVIPNTTMETLRICTGTDPLAPAPTSVTNRVDMDSVAIPTSQPFDTHTLTLEQSADLKLRKTVDAPLDVLNDDQVWTVAYANFSETVAVQPIRTIEVFPYMDGAGDGTPPGGPTRNPSSLFDGALTLTTVIDPKYANGTDVPGTVYYSADDPSTINQDWNFQTANAFPTTWCSSTDGVVYTLVHGSGTCPTTLADVTAWMFLETNNLAPASSPTVNRVTIPFTLQAGDPGDPLSVDANAPGDRYTNRFTSFSNTFVSGGLPQRLSSNTVRVRTLGFSVGDWIFEDLNGDGAYTDGTDLPVPDGVTVNLYYVPTSGPAVLLDTTTTVGGTYLFTDLPAGDFYIEIPATDFAPGGLLEGWNITPTPAAAPADVEQNDDVSHDAIPGTLGAVISNTFTLSATVVGENISGDEPLGDNVHDVLDPTLVTDGFNNFSIDLALQSPAVSIGDRVWLDVNRDGQQDANHTTEPGIVGVTVELLTAAGASIDPDGAGPLTKTLAITGADGFYSFTGLRYSTDFQLKFTLPAGNQFTSQFTGGILGDSNADTTTGIADVQTPADGANSAITPDEPTIDAGMVNVDLTLAKVRNTAPPMYPGGTVTFTLTPRNIGTTNALSGWKVTEVLPAGLTLVSMAGTGGPSTYTCVSNVCTSTVVLPAGGIAETILVTATIDAPTAATTLHNVAYVSPAVTEVTEANPLVTPITTTDTSTTLTNNDAQADVAVTPLISIGDTVWLDIDRDGIQDGGAEAGVVGVVVNLYAANGTTFIGTTTTVAGGFYSFKDLLPGTQYVVEFVKPVGSAFTTPAAPGSTTANDSDPNVTTGRTTITTPANGVNSSVTPDMPTIDAGLVRVDLTLDKALTSGGPFFVGSTVTFTLTPHNIGTTNALAGWSVTDILPIGLNLVSMAGTGGPSTYTCVGNLCTSSAVLPAGGTGETVLVTATVTAAFGGSVHNVAYISPAPTEVTETVPLITPDTNTNTATSPTNNDAQATLSAVSIGDYVWRDVNRDGIQDVIEPAVVGVVVNLYAADGTTFLATTTTNPNGFYSFVGLLPSTNYVVKFVAPVGEAFTLQNASGSTTVNDSNVNAAGSATVTTPASGTNSVSVPDEPTIDAGVVKVDLTLAKVLNTTGTVYPGDTVTYTLTPRNLGTTDALTGWSVTEVLPAGLTLVSMAGTGGPSTYTCVANVCTSSVVLPAGAFAETILVTATVNPTGATTLHNVAYVSPGPGEVPETNPLVIPTTSTNTSTSTTNNDAQADLTVTPLISIGDTVWLDVDRDGIQDGGAEVGVVGVTVNLYAANGTTLIGTTTTVAGGFYSFTGLNLSTQYVVEFVAPAGSSFTTPLASGSTTANDSNPVVATGRTTITTPANGVNSALTPDEPTIDAGLVRVDLALAKARVTAGPFYESSTVVFTLTPSNVGTTNALAGWKVTDILPTGLTAVSIAGSGGPSTYTCVLGTLTCTSSVVLPAGGTAETITVTATVDIDFVGSVRNVAYVSPAPTEVPEVNPLVTPTTSTDTSSTTTNNDAQAFVPVDSLVSIGDTVWLDVDRDGIQDGAEPGVESVTVNLYAADGVTFIKSTTTDSDGFYSFDDLVPGTSYVVEFVAPADHSFTTPGAPGSTVVNDSNATLVTGRATVVAPAVGANSLDTPDEPTIDAGLVNVDLALDKVLTTAPNFYPGKTVVYTLTPTNLGSTDALAGWSVTEVLPAGMTLVSMAGSAGPSIYTCVGNICTSTATSLAAGGTAETIIVTATIDANVSGVLHNVAYISPATTEVTEENPLGTPPTTSTDTDDSPTNNDDSVDLTSHIYDLALAKTGAVSGTGDDTIIDFTITVANQGTVPSGDYTVVDVVPPGLVPDLGTISDGGVYDSDAGTITWELSGLVALTGLEELEWSATVNDFTLRQYRNFAEITLDSGAPWGDDNDSFPDDDTTNDGDYDEPGVDNEVIGDAGNDADPEDDADIADVEVALTYDLALVKVASATSVNPSGTVTYTITVENQGDVNSGDYEITDTLPAGIAATSVTDGGVITPTTVTWNLTDLAAGATRSVSVTVAITDITKRPFKNIAELSEDGADEYDAVNPDLPGADIEDADSTPNTITGDDNGGGGDDGYGTFENPTNDIDDIADVDSIKNGEDDADVAFFDAPVLYDLALVKTGPASIDGAGTATFTLQIKNQGNVPSGSFTVLDTIPTGLQATAASDGGVIVGQSVTWNLSGLAAGATRSVTVTVRVSDFTTRPWVNVAEITVDGADGFDTDGYENPDDGDVEDDDSVPDANPANDTVVDQTTLPTDQHNDPAVDSDDHDIAPIDVNVVYDLALVKNLPGGQSFLLGSNITFTIQVKNQGNVNSGPITVQDVIPAGLSFVSASDGPLNAGQVVTWELASLAPGDVKTITIVVKIVDITLSSYVNFGEIVTDGADSYDTPGKDIEDEDSIPDSNINNDPVVDNDDINVDTIPGDEDDHDRSFLDPAKVNSDNPAPITAPLPATGSDSFQLLYAALGLLATGLLALSITRRRRRRVA